MAAPCGKEVGTPETIQAAVAKNIKWASASLKWNTANVDEAAGSVTRRAIKLLPNCPSPRVPSTKEGIHPVSRRTGNSPFRSPTCVGLLSPPVHLESL